MDPENALLIAEVALEYCWTDPTRREFSIKSSKTGMLETFYVRIVFLILFANTKNSIFQMFHSHLASRSFLNVFVPQSSHLLVYDLPSSSSASTGNVTTIPCQNAIFIEVIILSLFNFETIFRQYNHFSSLQKRPSQKWLCFSDWWQNNLMNLPRKFILKLKALYQRSIDTLLQIL